MKFKSALKEEMQSGPMHIRRCHCCGAVNEAESNLVDRCQSCQKQLISFFYFDECTALGLPTLKKKAQKTRLPREDYPPILGLTVYWEKAE